MPLSVAELMGKMPDAFMPEKAAGVEAVVHFKFSGAEPGEWNAVIKDGKCDVARGTPHSKPTLTVTADSANYVRIFTGELDGMQAFMQGKIQLAGDLNLAMKLTQMFKIRQAEILEVPSIIDLADSCNPGIRGGRLSQ